MQERHAIVTMQGAPLTLAGNEVKVGDRVPECELVGNDMNPVNSSEEKEEHEQDD